MATNSTEVPAPSPPVENELTETTVVENSVSTDAEPAKEADPPAAIAPPPPPPSSPEVHEEKKEEPTDQQKPEEDVVSSANETKETPVEPVEEPKPVSTKTRSVNFSSIEENAPEPPPKPRVTNSNSNSTRSSSSSYKPAHRKTDFIDALVDSYKMETSHNEPIITDEKKYVPKTTRSRLNPNWREHRTRRLMNKLEELSLWDREEELKASQAQSLRDQKWEQIQDRQRNHDLCLNLMRQRHESEMESAVLLDRGANGVNDENTTATIARTMKLATPTNGLGYDVPLTPSALRRRAKKDEETTVDMKTPIGRFRQFENNMNDKVDKINQKLQPDREIMRAYSPYRTSIPATATPLFSETYAALLSVPDTFSSNKYNQYHYGVASYLHQPNHASSPDYETRVRAYSNRDVRVPLKEQANDYNFHDDELSHNYNRSSNYDDDYPSKYRTHLTDDEYYPLKPRSNVLDDEQRSKYRSYSTDEDYYPSKSRSNVLDDEQRNKYRSYSTDEDYYPTKYRSNALDDEQRNKYRSYLTDDEYYPSKYRSSILDDEHSSKSRSVGLEDDYPSKYRSAAVEEDYPSLYRPTSTLDEENLGKYRSNAPTAFGYCPPKRTTTLASPTASALYDYSTVANTPRDFSFLHSRPPTSNSIHQRSLNDDLNAIARFSSETTKKILQNVADGPLGLSNKSSRSTLKHVSFNEHDGEGAADDLDDNSYGYSNHSSRHYASKSNYQPVEIISLSSTR